MVTMINPYTFTEIAQKELRFEATQEEVDLLWQNMESTDNWSVALRVMEEQTKNVLQEMAEIYEKEKDTWQRKRPNLYSDRKWEEWKSEHNKKQEPFKANLRKIYARLQEIKGYQRGLRSLRAQAIQIPPQQDLDELREQRDREIQEANLRFLENWRTGYTRGFKRSVDYFHSLLESGMPLQEARELLMSYYEEDLLPWIEEEPSCPPPSLSTRIAPTGKGNDQNENGQN